MARLSRRRSRLQAGMTLIEILVVCVVIALMAAAAMVNLGGLRRAKAEEEAMRFARLSRSALTWALTRATTVRLTIDLDNLTITPEAASGTALVDQSGRLVEDDTADAEEPLPEDDPAFVGTEDDRFASAAAGLAGEGMITEEEPEEGSSLGDLLEFSPALQELREPPKYRPPVFGPIDDSRLGTLRLGRMRALRVYLAGQEEPIESGVVYLIYRDDGTTDAAVLHLEDADGHTYAVSIDPLTGRGAVYPYPFLPEATEWSP